MAHAQPPTWHVPFGREAAAAGIGFLLAVLDRRGRSRARENLRVVLPQEASLAERRAAVLASFRHRARAWLDGIRPSAVLATRKDLWITARVGAWRRLDAVAWQEEEPAADRVRVPFFGLPVALPARAVRRALAEGRAVRAALALTLGNGRWEVWTSPDLTTALSSADREEATREVLARVADVLERVLRADPSLADWTAPWFAARPHPSLGEPGAAVGWPVYSRFRT